MNKENAGQPHPCSPAARARVKAKRAEKNARIAAEKAASAKMWGPDFLALVESITE